MNYVIDIVCKAMNQLSCPTSMFQRDGRFYIVSKDGIGQVNYGLNVYPRTSHMQDEPERPEILESQDILKKDKQEDKQVQKREAPHIIPIAFGSDTRMFSLEQMMRSGEQLNKVSDDGKIRMVSHGTQYHSHKYGYAADGIDVWLDAARVMDRNRYFDLMRQRQDAAVKALEGFKERIDTHRERHWDRDCVSEYKRTEIPTGVIMTPHLLITFPSAGELNKYGANNSWGAQTELETELVKHHEINTESETPFRMHMILNGAHVVVGNAKEFAEQCGALTGTLGKEISAINQVAPDIQSYIDGLNAVHKTVCAKEIQYWKEFRESLNKDRAPAKKKTAKV